MTANKFIRLTANTFFLLILAGCGFGDDCREYSDFTCKQIDKATYNAYFYFPDGKEYYLGNTVGLSSCGNMAFSYAASKDLSRGDGWSYICCMEAKGSSCYEKHR